MDKQETIIKIVDEIFQLGSPSIDNSRKNVITDFVVGAINGDHPADHLIITADLGDNKKGIIAYVLTDKRLVKIDIDPQGIESKSFLLNTITGVERKLVEGNQAKFSAFFQSGSFGLMYSPQDKKITNFFQKLDQVR